MSTEPRRPAEAEAEAEQISTIELLNIALRHIRLLVAVPLITVVIAVALAVLGGATYVAESSFKPETANLPGGGLMGLAAQFGVGVGGLTDGESVDYYARLIESREILTEVVRTEYPVVGEDGEVRSADLLTVYGVEAPTEQRRLWSAINRLRADMDITVDHAASVVTLVTEAPSADLAEQVNAQILAEMAEFNLEKRQSRGRAEREFVEAQAAEAEAQLRAAETRLADFLAQNRRYQNSPEMVNEADRLRRDVEMREMLYSSLSQSLAEARLDEVRNTPVFTVLDRPEGSAREKGGLLLRLVMGLLLGLALAGLWTFVAEYAARQRAQHPEDYRELRARLDAFRRRLPWRRGPGGRSGGEALPTSRESARASEPLAEESTRTPTPEAEEATTVEAR